MIRVLLGGLLAPLPVVLVSPSIDTVVSTALLVAAGLVVLGWLALHALGELALAREFRRPSGRMPERESVLRRVEQPTTADTVASLTARCAELEATTAQLRERLAETGEVKR